MCNESAKWSNHQAVEPLADCYSHTFQSAWDMARGHASAVDFLLAQGIDSGELRGDGRSALHISCQRMESTTVQRWSIKFSTFFAIVLALARQSAWSLLPIRPTFGSLGGQPRPLSLPFVHGPFEPFAGPATCQT